VRDRLCDQGGVDRHDASERQFADRLLRDGCRHCRVELPRDRPVELVQDLCAEDDVERRVFEQRQGAGPFAWL